MTAHILFATPVCARTQVRVFWPSFWKTKTKRKQGGLLSKNDLTCLRSYGIARSRKSPSFAVVRNCGIASSFSNADVKAFERLQSVCQGTPHLVEGGIRIDSVQPDDVEVNFTSGDDSTGNVRDTRRWTNRLAFAVHNLDSHAVSIGPRRVGRRRPR